MTKWQQAVDQLVKESGVTVRQWRNHDSGAAYCEDDDWGVEIPIPKGPVTFCTAAHEIGHQLMHRKERRAVKEPRWVEEVEAWEYALVQLERFELPGYDRAMRSVVKSIDYAFGKARRRGVPLEVIEEKFPEWIERIRVAALAKAKEAT